MSRLRFPLTMNPVLQRELIERMRSPRASIIVGIFLALLGAILYMTYRLGSIALTDMFAGARGAFGIASLGRLMFETLLLFLAIFVAFIIPGTASGSIAGERDKRTLPLLQITLLKPHSIVLGKLGTSIAFALLLVIATAPLFAIPLSLGGITAWQVIRGFVVLIVIAFFLASLGIFVSAFTKRVQFATINTYALTFFFILGTFLLWGLEAVTRSERMVNLPDRPITIYLNPIIAIADAVGGPREVLFVPAPLSSLRTGVHAWIISVEAGADVRRAPQPVPVPVQPQPFPPRAGTDALQRAEAAAAVAAASDDVRAQGQEGPEIEIASGAADGDPWTVSAIQRGNGNCLSFRSPRKGSRSCRSNGGPVFSQDALLGATRIIYGEVPAEAATVVLGTAPGDPPENSERHDVIVKEGFVNRFFVIVVPFHVQPLDLLVLDAQGQEIVRSPLTLGRFQEAPPAVPLQPGIREQVLFPNRNVPSVWTVHVAMLILLSLSMLAIASRRLRVP